ncbi:hypothetical protein Moror_1119 [Moniliophthora roreri MCA 2997]|uniref:Uncharacterized protein n=2 Tax=Moniliophthora roreri TaxID=221103 RepID=V2X261_MONRO|nr:hypothetical protein Moror_1119 [Moniliophthora roreri MCA 2997]
MFNNAQNVTIGGNATNIVHRDQYNGTIINAQVVHIENVGRVKVQRGQFCDSDSEYEQYREIIRGDIHKLEQLSSEDCRDREWKGGKVVRTYSYRVTAHRVRVFGDDRVFTAFSYHGQDAEKIWKKEFMRWSQANDSAVTLQLFAINHSKVPTLLFYDEWLSLGHLHSKMKGTFWEGYYLEVYTDAWQRKIDPDYIEHLWLNSRTGRVSSGPDGSYTDREHTRVLYNCEDMPSAMEMADSKTCIRFFSETGAGNLDLDVLQYAYDRLSLMPIENLLGIDPLGGHDGRAHSSWRKNTCHGPWRCDLCDGIACDEVQDFIGKLRFDSIYSGVQLEKVAFLKEGPAHGWEIYSDVLSDRTLTDGGLTRFQYVGFQSAKFIRFYTEVLGKAWLTQVHRPDLSTSDSETCFIPSLWFYLRVESQLEQFDVSALETLPIVYLFLRPPPPCVADSDSWMSQATFWSFDKDGTSEIPETECERLGLPKIALSFVQLRLERWPKYVYNAIHAWQVARGSNPATADFARSLGMPIFEPVTTRFEEIIEQESLTCSSLPEPEVHSIQRDPDNPSASSQLSPLPATRIPRVQTLQKRKRIKVVIIHDTDSESEPESAQNSHQLSVLKQK